MMKLKIAVLLTCYNRVSKTINCLSSVYKQENLQDIKFDVFLVDDNSKDNTGNTIQNLFPEVKVLNGTGSLFWVGGMRMAWTAALQNNYDGYLLLNDDVLLYPTAINNLVKTHNFSVLNYMKEGIYIGSTTDPVTNKISYGGRKLKNKLSDHSTLTIPDQILPVECDLAHANILLVMKNVTAKIGILSDKFTQRLADYDYTLKAKKSGFPLLVSPGFYGQCADDHGRNWLSSTKTLKERVSYLKDPRHLAYHEYLYFIKTHFPIYLPAIFSKLWIKTLFPAIWDKLKMKTL